MKLVHFKSLGVELPVIGQGTMGLGGYMNEDRSSDQAHVDALRLGMDLGMTLLDTAEVYGRGHAEELVGQAIQGRRDGVFLASKVSPEHLSPPLLKSSCESSLRRLGTDVIDLYQIHWPNPGVPIADSIGAMCHLRDQGKIRHIGVSNFSLGQLNDAAGCMGGDGIVSNQVEYNLFDRTIERDLLPYCQCNGQLVMAYSPLDQGAVTSNSRNAQAVVDLAGRFGMTPSQMALAWLVRRQNVVAIPKAISHEHIRSNAAAADLVLPDECESAINDLLRTDPVDVLPARIKVVMDGAGNRQTYQTIDDARANRLGFEPSPAVLADDLRGRTEPIKPVRVRQSLDMTGRYDFDLVEGRIRYWAWVIAKGWNVPIRVLIRG